MTTALRRIEIDVYVDPTSLKGALGEITDLNYLKRHHAKHCVGETEVDLISITTGRGINADRQDDCVLMPGTTTSGGRTEHVFIQCYVLDPEDNQKELAAFVHVHVTQTQDGDAYTTTQALAVTDEVTYDPSVWELGAAFGLK